MRIPTLGVSLRTRLTVWYGALLAVTLLLFSGLMYFTLLRSLSQGMDDTLRLRADQIRRVLGPGASSLLQPEDVPPGQVERRPLDEFAAPGIYVQLLNPRGGVVFAPSNLAGGELPVTDASLDAIRANRETRVDVHVTSGAEEADVRVLTLPLYGASGDVVGAVQVGQSLAPLQSTMSAVGRLLSLAGALALLLAMAVGSQLTRRALSPLARITATAEHIAATGDYRQRLHVAEPHLGAGDELFFLASTFNAMIARLEHVLESQRRLLADTSHELRNPLTVIRGNLALLRRDGVPEITRREAVGEADDEAARMGRLVNDLLLLARADAGETPPARRDLVDLRSVASEVVEQARPSAGARMLELGGGNAASNPSLVLGDRDRLKQLVANLVSNAIRYTPERDGAWIRVDVDLMPASSSGALQRGPVTSRSPAWSSRPTEHPMATSHVQLTVADSGIGISPEHVPHVFDRFYRVDKARTRAEGGAGLGLSIARYIAQSHGGTLDAESAGPEQGSTFRLLLPCAPAQAAIGGQEQAPSAPHEPVAAVARGAR